MNNIKELWLNVRARVNTLDLGTEDVMNDEEIKFIDYIVDEVERLRLENAQLRSEALTKQKEEVREQRVFISETKYHVTDRGIIYVVDMSSYPDAEIKLEDVITIDNKVGIVEGIKGTRNLFGELGSKIGILFREIQTI